MSCIGEEESLVSVACLGEARERRAQGVSVSEVPPLSFSAKCSACQSAIIWGIVF